MTETGGLGLLRNAAGGLAAIRLSPVNGQKRNREATGSGFFGPEETLPGCPDALFREIQRRWELPGKRGDAFRCPGGRVMEAIFTGSGGDCAGGSGTAAAGTPEKQRLRGISPGGVYEHYAACQPVMRRAP